MRGWWGGRLSSLPGAFFLAALGACGGAAPQPRTLALVQATPEAGATGVYLNEQVLLFFSERLDPASVHARSARVVAADGTPARGDWEVQGRRLAFLPAPVLAPDLSDGGYRPGQRYTVELAGFPRPDGLRGESGAPLARSVRLEFEVVEVVEPRAGFVFEDASLETGRPLFLRTPVLDVGQPLELEGEEPLDPATLFGEDFLLVPRAPGAEQVALRARLTENFDKHAPRSRGTTRVELVPSRLLQSGETYWLRMAPGARLRDFGGNPVPLFSTVRGRRAQVEVREPLGALRDVHFESFLGIENRSAAAVAEADGSAWWRDSGRVEVRLPATVGSGEDGEVTLTGDEPRRDVQAVRLSVPRGATARLADAPGLVVLRAQGSLRVEGTLERHGGGGLLRHEPGETLSQWLARAASGGGGAVPIDPQDLARGLTGGVTVLVAGGDLVVNGRLFVDGPLVLVAGGRLRVGAGDRIECRKLWVDGEGAERLRYVDPRVGPLDAAALPLSVDAPLSNPLAAPLTFAVRSGPIPRYGSALRWHAARVGARAGAGAWRVRYAGERRERAPGEPAEILVDDPVLLSDCPVLRLQIELEVVPGPVWDPPWVDFVEVSWDRPSAERER